MGTLLNEIQQKLKVPKSQYNKFSEFYYRNAEDIMEAVKPLLGNGTLVLTDELVQVGERYYVKATAHLWNGDDKESRNWSAVGWAREALERAKFDGAQLTGAASSYARKYALNGLFCIDDTKDADNHDNGESAPQTAKSAPQRMAAGDEALSREKARKDRILANLKRLGKSVKTKEQVSQAVFDLVGMELVPEKYDEIGEALGKLR